MSDPSTTGGVVIEFLPPVAFLVSDLIRLAEDLSGYKEPLTRAVTEVVGPSIATNFDVGGRPPWPELTEETIFQKASLGYSDTGILVRTGDLRDAASSVDIWTIDDDSAAVEGFPDEVFYGTFHEQGTEYMPSRPFMMIQPEDADQIVEVFDTWIGERLGDNGF